MRINPLGLVLIAACWTMASCVPLTFDNKSWQRTSARTNELQDVTFSMGLFPLYSNAVGNRSGGPWRINLHSISKAHKDIRILRVTATCAEGVLRVFDGDAALPQTRPWNDGRWQGYWVPEENPLSFNPVYHPEQKVVVRIELRIDGGPKKILSATFVPRHITGRETVNLLFL